MFAGCFLGMAVHFKNLVLETRPNVYEPHDDSFFLAASQRARPGDRVLDMGTGTGIQALVAAQRAGEVVGADINPDAVSIAGYNANLNHIFNAGFVLSDLFENVQGRFSLILFNPPYLPVMDDDMLGRAWSGGERGTQVLMRFLEEAGDYLEKGGVIQVLASSLNDQEALEKLFERMGFHFNLDCERNLFFEKLFVYALAKKPFEKNILDESSASGGRLEGVGEAKIAESPSFPDPVE